MIWKPWTRSYKHNFGVGNAGFCYAEILNKDFLVKNYGELLFSVNYAKKVFLGLGPDLSGSTSLQNFHKHLWPVDLRLCSVPEAHPTLACPLLGKQHNTLCLGFVPP